jgi:HAD superfamily hydrolase (TIGR01509 family)
MIEAVLFDMDGVLVDSEEYINQAAIQFFSENGLDVKPEDFEPFIGAGENRYIGGVAEKYGLNIEIEQAKKRTYEIYEQIVSNNLSPLEGVMEFIEKAKKRKLKLAVATSADEVKMKINLKESGIDEALFDTLVNGSQIDRKKPDPEIYLKAAKQLGVDPKKCLVVEDAVNGVEAAKAAGSKCVAVQTSFSASQLAQADWIFESLSDVTKDVFEW